MIPQSRMAAESPERSTAEPYPSIGKYEILGRIGQGAMGEVFKARDTILDRFVAIKTMSAGVLSDVDLRERFLREARSAARLNHPSVVTLHEFGEANGQLFMAMELLEGEDLKQQLRQGKPETLEAKLAVMEQILDGVAYAHSAGVVHRDLKPANIHVQRNGRVKVMDFGLARLGESEMTRSGTVMGTPNYMSPEQVRGERVTPASDVFALGAVCYELLGGRRAFSGETMHSVLYQVTDAEPASLRELSPHLPGILITFVETALAKSPAARFPDGRAMRSGLEMCRQVLDGTLDEREAAASLRESQTLIQGPDDPGATLPGATGAHSAATVPPSSVRRPPARAASGSRPGTTLLEEPRSRPVLHVGLGIVATLLLGGAALLLLRREPAPGPADGTARALVAVAVQSQLEAARRSFELKDLERAVAAAGRALQLEKDNVEAQEILRRATAASEEAGRSAREAREAAEAGDTAAARRALARVMELDPRNPVVAELSGRLEARAEALPATQREVPAARQDQGQATARPAPSRPVARATAAPTAKSGPVAAASTPPSAAPLAASVATPPPPVASTAAAPPQASAPAAAPPSVAAPAQAPPAKPKLSDADAVRQLLDHFERAIREKDLVLYKSLRPGLSSEEERRLKEAFENVASQQLRFRIDSIVVDGDEATVRVTRSGSVAGQAVPASRQVLKLGRQGGGWVIRDISR